MFDVVTDGYFLAGGVFASSVWLLYPVVENWIKAFKKPSRIKALEEKVELYGERGTRDQGRIRDIVEEIIAMRSANLKLEMIVGGLLARVSAIEDAGIGLQHTDDENERGNGLDIEGRCVKCGAQSGDTWRQCDLDCPVVGSPHYRTIEDPFRVVKD